MQTFIVVDLETTGLSPETDHIIEIGALKYVDGTCVEMFSQLVKPPVSISRRIYEITGIDDAMVKGQPEIQEAMEKFLEFVGKEQVLLGHNIRFDYSFLKTAAKRLKYNFSMKCLDTLGIARKVLPDLPKKNLETVSSHYHIVNPRAHRAYEDAKTRAMVYECMWKEFGMLYPEVFQPKDIQIKVKKAEPITLKQKNYLIDLLKYHKIQGEAFFSEKGKQIDALTKSEASKIIDEIIFQYGRIIRGN